MDALPANTATVNQVDMISRAKQNQAGETYQAVCFDFDASHETAGADADPGAGYGNRTDSDIAEPNAGSWLPEHFQVDASPSVQVAVRKTNAGGGSVQCTSLYFNVDYTLDEGAFPYLLSQWLPPLLAVASHGLLAREVVTILGSLKNRPSSKEEFARILEAFCRRPVFV